MHGSNWKSLPLAFLLLALLVSGLVGCGGSDDAASTGNDAKTDEAASADRSGSDQPTGAKEGTAPQVEVEFQQTINEAWQKAVAGESPTIACARVKGRAAGAGGVADRALAACNVDVPVRYFEARLERVERGEATCIQLMTHILTQLPAMTVAVDGLADLAGQGDAQATGAVAAALTGAVAGGDEAQRLIKERLREPLSELCPEEASIVLG